MSELKIYNLQREEVGAMTLDPKVSEVEMNPFIVKDVVVKYHADRRQGTHKVKGRSEVRGSKKKLFRQKGTGNARAGYPQSPIRRGGGVVFGPVPRDYSFSLNKKVRKKALACVITDLVKNSKVHVVESLTFDTHKTKNTVSLLSSLNLEKVLFVFSEMDKNFYLSSRNLSGVKTVHSSAVHVFDLLKYKNLVIEKKALQEVEGRLLK